MSRPTALSLHLGKQKLAYFSKEMSLQCWVYDTQSFDSSMNSMLSSWASSQKAYSMTPHARLLILKRPWCPRRFLAGYPTAADQGKEVLEISSHLAEDEIASRAEQIGINGQHLAAEILHPVNVQRWEWVLLFLAPPSKLAEPHVFPNSAPFWYITPEWGWQSTFHPWVHAIRHYGAPLLYMSAGIVLIEQGDP